jgi:hypothetical protein
MVSARNVGPVGFLRVLLEHVGRQVVEPPHVLAVAGGDRAAVETSAVAQVDQPRQQVSLRRRSFRGAVLAADDPPRPLEGLAAHQRLVGVLANHPAIFVQAAELASPLADGSL